MLEKIGKILTSSWAVTVVAALLILLYLQNPSILQTLQLKTFDWLITSLETVKSDEIILVEFGEKTVEKLGLKNVIILKNRAEELKIQAQIVTSRAVAPLGKLLTWSIPLVVKNGKVLAIKGNKASEELEVAKKEIPTLKSMTSTIKTCGRALDLNVTVVEVKSEG